MASILRETIHAPRLGGVSHFVHEYDRARFLQVAESAWVDLLHRLEHPIQTRQAKTRRSVTVLGFARYVASREDGTLSLLQPKASSHPQRWRKVQFPFSVDLPFKPTEGLFEECLARWRSALVSYAISDAACCDLWRRLVRRRRVDRPRRSRGASRRGDAPAPRSCGTPTAPTPGGRYARSSRRG